MSKELDIDEMIATLQAARKVIMQSTGDYQQGRDDAAKDILEKMSPLCSCGEQGCSTEKDLAVIQRAARIAKNVWS